MTARSNLPRKPNHSHNMIAAKLFGVWRLVSTEQRMADGTRRPSRKFGPHGVGFLFYSYPNRMCAMLVDPSRAHWKSEDDPTAEELRATFDHFNAYTGTFEVNAQEGFLVHHIEVGIVPNETGESAKRYFQFVDEQLVLRPAPPLPNSMLEYTLTWAKVIL
jgi:Lipocalin-like domain